MPWALAVAVLGGGFGLLIGSFLNVVVYRVPNGMSVVSPPSACPGCHSEIKAYDNVPVLSWLALRGKCRSCHEPISARYPLVEATTGVFFVVVAIRFLPHGLLSEAPANFGASLLALVAFLYLAAISVALGLIDLDVHRLPRAIVLPAYAVGAVLLGASSALTGDWTALLRAAIGMGSLGLFYALAWFFYPAGMGFGDVTLAGVLGLFLGWLGWGPLAVGAFSAFLFGGVFSIALIALKRIGRKGGIPFGPWMLVGAWVGVFVGPAVWHGYLSLLGVA
ncbi:leader peptidase (prepilin peptidase)/N-methyltransferase [Frondihabitans sp. PhB188]|nr:A24 family peptidase [Frondihabitans sp. PhB188]ROQ37388.1 leader peptidase (prepilin peptidase)/N-methyltransferase [Frondihabitans sp. PhB188]